MNSVHGVFLQNVLHSLHESKKGAETQSSILKDVFPGAKLEVKLLKIRPDGMEIDFK